MSGFNYSHNGLTLSSRPGAWMYDGSTHAWPIFNSGDLMDVTNSIYTHNGSYPPLNNKDDAWAVLPGFKLELFFNGDNGGSKYTLDNTDGATYLTKKNEDINSSFVRNQISSVRLYYRGTEMSMIARNFAISGRYSISQTPTHTFIYILEDSSFNYSGSEAALTDISMLIVGGGGSGGGDGGYTGGGGGGGGEVGIGSITINANQDYSIYVGAGGGPSNGGYSSIYNQSNSKIVEVYGGGRGTDNPGTRHSGASSGVASGAGGSGADTTSGTANGHDDTNIYTFYSNNGGSGYPGRGGGGGGGAGASGGNAGGWEGGNGGNGIQWLDTSGGNGEYYGGGGAGQGVNDYPNRSSGGTGGGGRSGNNGVANTGGGGSAKQGNPAYGYASGGSGVVVFRVTNAQLDS